MTEEGAMDLHEYVRDVTDDAYDEWFEDPSLCKVALEDHIAWRVAEAVADLGAA